MSKFYVRNGVVLIVALLLLGLNSCVPLVLGGAAAYAIGEEPAPRGGLYDE